MPDTLKLKNTLLKTIDAIQKNHVNAKAAFNANTKLVNGVKCKAAIRQFDVDFDEPHGLGGDDTAPNPVEYLLAALGTCQEILYSAFATVQGIPVESIAVDVKGNLDLRGLFGLDESVPAGFQEISYHTTITSDAEPEIIKGLINVVENHCPVLDTLTRQVKINGRVSVIKSKEKITISDNNQTLHRIANGY